MIKGKKPNSFFIGFHSEAEMRLQREWSARIGADLRYSPTPIETTSRRLRAERTNIRCPATLSFR